jgi:hypothetical protein
MVPDLEIVGLQGTNPVTVTRGYIKLGYPLLTVLAISQVFVKSHPELSKVDWVFICAVVLPDNPDALDPFKPFDLPDVWVSQKQFEYVNVVEAVVPNPPEELLGTEPIE